MITDNNRANGVPNRNAFSTQGINQRTQLVKPTQVNNTGLTRPATQNPVRPVTQTPRSGGTQMGGVNTDQFVPTTASAPTAPSSSPLLRANNPSVAAPAVPNIPSPDNARITSPNLPLDNISGAAAVTPSGMDQARSAIRGMSSQDIITLLNEIASGNLKGVD